MVAGGSSGARKPPMVIESAHEYENNMREHLAIEFPGATKLIVEFDSQCTTENGCDALYFYPEPDKAGDLIHTNTGPTFTNFEYEGDQMFSYFETDSSCTQWGYLYTVTPVYPPSSGGSSDPNAEKAYLNNALWILDFVASFEVLPDVLSIFGTGAVANPLTVLIHSIKDAQVKNKLLRSLKGILLKAEIPTSELLAIANLLKTETADLYELEKPEDKASESLQNLTSLIIELKEKYDITCTKEWFVKLVEGYERMQGMAYRNEYFKSQMLEAFKLTTGINNDVLSRESLHPYSHEFQTKILTSSYLTEMSSSRDMR
jgi:hypothetical protein